MPVKSEKQRRFMYASLAGKTDVPPSVAKKFVGPKAHADGGAVKESVVNPSKRKPAPKPPVKTAPKPAPRPKPEPLSPSTIESLRNSSRMEEQDRNNRAAERFFGNPDPESAGYAKGGMTKAKMKKVFGGKETAAEERKEKTAAKKAGMSYAAAERRFEPGKHKAMRRGGSCK
jgi:hypothetical protein